MRRRPSGVGQARGHARARPGDCRPRAVHPADIDRPAGARPAERRRIHVFIATSDLHLERKLRISRDACLDAAVAAVHPPGATRRSPVLRRRCDAQRPGLPLPGGRGGDLRRVHDGQPAGHGRLFDARRDRRVFPDHPGVRLECPARRLQHPLPRRPRAGGGQHAGGGLRRRDAGGVHGQRHRRAGRQRVTRRDRLAMRVRADLLPCETRIAPGDLPVQRCSRALTGESVQSNKAIVAPHTPSRTKRAYRTECSRDRRTYEIHAA